MRHRPIEVVPSSRPLGALNPRAMRVTSALVAGTVAAAALASLVTMVPTGAQAAAAGRPLPARLHGITVDDIDGLPAVLASVKGLSRMPTARIVFDAGMNPDDYAPAVDALRPSAYLMGTPYDSTELKNASAAAYHSRFASYLSALGGKVDIWEVGNEVNGNWTGPYSSVAAKVTDATDQVAAVGGRSALTVYYNDGCGDGASELDPLPWSQTYLSAATRAKLTYVLVSYYEDQCGYRRPSAQAWTSYFQKLRVLYPNAQVGFGEVGYAEPLQSADQARAIDLIKYYYTLPVELPYYMLGGFYWNYVEDMLPHSGNPVWNVLNAAVATGPVTLPTVTPPATSTVRPTTTTTVKPTTTTTIRPTVTSTVTPTASPTTTTTRPALFSETWSGFTAPSAAWVDGSVHGAWTTQFGGYGRVGIDSDGGNVLSAMPARPSSSGDTHAALVTSTERFGDLDLSVRLKTVSQLRTGAYPGAVANAWERAWTVWHYGDDTHFYYLVLKANGWELGKADPAYPGAQRFLATGSGRTFPVGVWNTVRIQQTGSTITVDVDGARLTSFTDTQRPYLNGPLGLYTEDSSVRFGRLTVG